MFPSDNFIVKIPHCANHLGASAAVTEPTLPADQSKMIWIYLLQIQFNPAQPTITYHENGGYFSLDRIVPVFILHSWVDQIKYLNIWLSLLER